MGWILAIIVGGIVGYVASLIMHTQESTVANIVIGVVGAVLARWLLADVLGIGGAASAGSVSLSGFFWSLVGAIIVLGVLRAFRAVGNR